MLKPYKILDCTNLLGDSIYLPKPAKLYIEKHTEEFEIAVVANPGISFEIFDRCLSSLVSVYKSVDAALLTVNADVEIIKLQAGLASELGQRIYQATKKQLHISECYAEMLGVALPGETDEERITPMLDWVDRKSPVKKEYFVVSPFSRSCTRHSGLPPNKTLDDWKWRHIIGYLKRQGYPVKVMGAPKDRLEGVAVPDNDYLCASTLSGIQEELNKAIAVITVDNGIGHFASALYLDNIILWPVVSRIEFIGSLFSPKTRFLMGFDPNIATPAQIIMGLRSHLKGILNERD